MPNRLQSPEKPVQLSVVICTYCRDDHAEASATAIGRCRTFDPRTMEIIIVNNSPPSERRPLNIPPSARVVPCNMVGLSAARNAGIAAAGGEIIAFIDDDARVHDGWCAAVLAAFHEHRGAYACGGPVRPRFRTPELPPWFYPELTFWLSCIDWDSIARPLRPDEWLVGANMAFRRWVFDKFGCFDPGLGRKGDRTLLSSEESALLRHVGKTHVYFVPDMQVDHVIESERTCIDWFRRRVFWQAISDKLTGEPPIDFGAAQEEISRLAARPAAHLQLLSLPQKEPRTPDEARDQLRLVYLMTLLLAEGLPIFK